MEIGSESKNTTGSKWRHIIYLLKCLFFFPKRVKLKDSIVNGGHWRIGNNSLLFVGHIYLQLH